MHLVVGFIRIVCAHAVARLYRTVHLDIVGRRVIGLCCNAFSAGAGLDDAAFEVLKGLGPDAERLLQMEVEGRDAYRRSTAGLFLKWFEIDRKKS